MSPEGGFTRRRATLAVAILCAVTVALAIGWAIVLPIFLSPDEDNHYDYALTLFTAGRPMHPNENLVGKDTHPVVDYLMSATHARQQRLDYAVGADRGFGTPAYDRALDAGAPRVDPRAFAAGPISPAPYISRLYPIGYYALAASAIALGDRLTHGSIVGQFYFARYLSIVLLVPALVFSWPALLELRIGTRRATLLFACTALLPMTAWMAGYVQPDDLVCALVAPILYLALRLRRNPGDARILGALGLLLAALMATKQQYFLAVYLPIVALLAARIPFAGWALALRAFAFVTLPAFAAFAVTEPMLRAAPGGGGVCRYANPLGTAAHAGPAALAAFFAHGISTTVTGAFFVGSGLESFWIAYGAYRNDAIVLGTPAATTLALALFPAVSPLFVILFLARVVRVAPRLLAVARRRSWRSAARVATSNVLVNGYLCYFAILCGFEMSIGGHVPVQGRYWLPFASAVWVMTVVIAPRALPHRFGRAVSTSVLASILAFDVLATAFTFPSLHARFYAPVARHAPDSETYADVAASARDGDVLLRGRAIDLRDASPVERVVLRIDATLDVPAHDVARPDTVCDMETTLLQTGFETRLPARALRAGKHRVRVYVETPWSNRLVDTGAHTSFAIR